jgi:two-component system response regulator
VTILENGKETRSQSNNWRRKRLRAPPRVMPVGPILIVDDDLDDANLARRIVLKLFPESEVVVCGSARKAVEYLEAGSIPALMLLDLRMPEMDGFAFLEWLTSHGAHVRIPVVVLSGLHELEHLRRAYSLHARAFLVKPVTLESLRSVFLSLNFAV